MIQQYLPMRRGSWIPLLNTFQCCCSFSSSFIFFVSFLVFLGLSTSPFPHLLLRRNYKIYNFFLSPSCIHRLFSRVLIFLLIFYGRCHGGMTHSTKRRKGGNSNDGHPDCPWVRVLPLHLLSDGALFFSGYRLCCFSLTYLPHYMSWHLLQWCFATCMMRMI